MMQINFLMNLSLFFCAMCVSTKVSQRKGMAHKALDRLSAHDACGDGCFAFQGRNRLEEGAGGVLAGRYGYVRLPEGRDL